MRTVHTYIHAPQQQTSSLTPQQQQQQPIVQQTSSSSSSSSSTSTTTTSTAPTNLHQHSSISGYPSVRHSLFRMHSQLRSAPNRRESNNQGGPIDLSLYRVSPTTSSSSSKMTTRSTSTTTATSTMLRSIPIIAPIATTPTQTIYSNAIPSSSFSMNLDQPMKIAQTFTSNDTQKSSSICQKRSSSPKLAYSYTNIEENLQCPLCIDRLRDPRALPCQHVFCCSCLKSMPLSNLPHSTIACPLCRQTFPYIRDRKSVV